MTKVTPASLRAEADKQRVRAPHRDGWNVTEKTRQWDALIVRRQLAAQRWRNKLASVMEHRGITVLHATTVRVSASHGRNTYAVACYSHSDGSVFIFRNRETFMSPEQFVRHFAGYTVDGIALSE